MSDTLQTIAAEWRATRDVIAKALCDFRHRRKGRCPTAQDEQRAATIIARLADHDPPILWQFIPRDDDDAPDEAWLRSVGFWERGRSDLCYLCSPRDGSPKWMLIREDDWNPPHGRVWSLRFPGVQQSLGYDLPTRGDVRRLCRALGITLKEGK